MNNIDLRIDGGSLDINPDSLSIALNKQSVDFNNPDKRVGNFSYTIKIPVTDNNRRIFKYINDIHIKGRFDKEEYYSAELEVNGVIILEGYFILRKITPRYFEGNLLSPESGIVLDFGTKSLRDLNLPTIPFEGLMIPVKTLDANRLKYVEASGTLLNKDLAFDYRSFITGVKDPNLGLIGSSVDYSDYYTTSLIAYNNFYAPSLLGSNVLNNSFDLYQYIPQLRYIKVLEQIFIDAGYNPLIKDSLLNEPELLIPYVGDLPPLNWKHLSRTSVYYDKSMMIEGPTYEVPTDTLKYNQFIKHPLISSRGLDSTRNVRTFPDKYQQFTDIIGLRPLSGAPLQINDYAQHNFVWNYDDASDIQTHYMLTNGLNHDFMNSFKTFNPPTKPGSNTGQVYTVPADGEYEFELDITHHIRTYCNRLNTDGVIGAPTSTKFWRDDEWKTSLSGINGYDGQAYNNTWLYNGQEQFFASNMVAFVKDEMGPDSIASSLQGELTDLPNVDLTDKKYKTIKKLKNWGDDNVIAYYHPMLRDLYTGGYNATWENYIQREKSILVNNNPIPTGSEIDDLIYMGFGKDTTILNYENRIGYDSTVPDPVYSGYNDNYSREQQYRRKLVRTKKLWGDEYTGLGYVGKSKVRERYTFGVSPFFGNMDTFGNYADGQVKFKFRAKLKAGDRIRMVYITMNQFKMVGRDRYWLASGLSDVSDQFKYNDYYADEYEINSYTIKSVDDSHDYELKLSNFLPDIKQKDFISEFLKSNNLYMTVDGKNVIFKNRSEYLDLNPQSDLTDKMLNGDIEMTPLKVTSETQYGMTTKDGYDYNGDVDNEIISLKNDSIYGDGKVVDLTNKLFSSTIDKNFEFRYYRVDWQGGYRVDWGGPYDSVNISMPSFHQGGTSNVPNPEVNYSMKVNAHLVNYVGSSQGDNVKYLINGIPFYNLPLRTSTSFGGYLDNENRSYQFEDRIFNNNSDLTQVEAYFNLSKDDYNNLDLSKAVRIDNALYFIQKIVNYNPLNNKLTKMILIKI